MMVERYDSEDTRWYIQWHGKTCRVKKHKKTYIAFTILPFPLSEGHYKITQTVTIPL